MPEGLRELLAEAFVLSLQFPVALMSYFQPMQQGRFGAALSKGDLGDARMTGPAPEFGYLVSDIWLCVQPRA